MRPRVRHQTDALFTIGYQGSDIDTFIGTLEREAVEILVDVRDLPLSRKRGFSKNGLRQRLSLAGIGYIHEKNLGDPKEGRVAARNRDWVRFQEIFRRHISSEAAASALLQLSALAPKRRICLMCFEREHSECHRAILVEEVLKLNRMAVKHLEVAEFFYQAA